MQIPRGEVVGIRLAVPGVGVGPADEISNCTLQKGGLLLEEKQREDGECDHSLVGPGGLECGGVSGPVGPQASNLNVTLGIEAQQSEATILSPSAEAEQLGLQIDNDVAVNEDDEVELCEEHDVEGNGVTGASRSSQIPETQIVPKRNTKRERRAQCGRSLPRSVFLSFVNWQRPCKLLVEGAELKMVTLLLVKYSLKPLLQIPV
jgi:hypothetical protein